MVQNFENKMLMEFLVSSRQVSIRKITQLESDEIFCWKSAITYMLEGLPGQSPSFPSPSRNTAKFQLG